MFHFDTVLHDMSDKKLLHCYGHVVFRTFCVHIFFTQPDLLLLETEWVLSVKVDSFKNDMWIKYNWGNVIMFYIDCNSTVIFKLSQEHNKTSWKKNKIKDDTHLWSAGVVCGTIVAKGGMSGTFLQTDRSVSITCSLIHSWTSGQLVLSVIDSEVVCLCSCVLTSWVMFYFAFAVGHVITVCLWPLARYQASHISNTQQINPPINTSLRYTQSGCSYFHILYALLMPDWCICQSCNF